MSFKWNKLGKIFDPKDLSTTSWMKEFAQSPSVIIEESYVRVFFCSRKAPDSNGQYISYTSYVDLDRSNLFSVLDYADKPLIELGSYGAFDEFGTNPVSVIKHEDTLRAYYAGWTRCEAVPFNAAIGMAISQDGGKSFERIGNGPVLSYTSDEPFLLGSPRIRNFGGKWQLWYVAGKEWRNIAGKAEPLYKIRMAESEDGIDWKRHGLDIITDKLGEDECQACADVIFRNDKYHMFFSYRKMTNYKKGEGGYRIGYAVSSDMKVWQRNDDLVDICCSETGWDSEMISYPNVFELDGSIYMLYQGNGMGKTGFGLASLELDGSL
jgi:predicted GH43/DUF377 family glycosyl hydrolase